MGQSIEKDYLMTTALVKRVARSKGVTMKSLVELYGTSQGTFYKHLMLKREMALEKIAHILGIEAKELQLAC